MLYYIAFAVSFLCFLYHTLIHILEHFRKIPESKMVYATIGISMFFAWVFYFMASLMEMTSSLSYLSLAGLVMLIAGFYLFFAAHAKVHKRMHSGKGKLVTEGLYGKIRHPMYVGEILMLIGAPVFGGSWLTLALSPLLIVQILVWAYIEEKDLMKEFPEYAAYRKKTWF
jgi:protein-S-isoprenylcysteine O-methyltransferase Ste14